MPEKKNPMDWKSWINELHERTFINSKKLVQSVVNMNSDHVKSLPADELVKRWVETNDASEEKKLGEEIKRRTNVMKDGEPLFEIKQKHSLMWVAPPQRLPAKEGTKIIDFDYSLMKRLQARTKNILGEEAVDIIRRLGMGNPKELIDRLDRARRLNGMRREVRLRRAI